MKKTRRTLAHLLCAALLCTAAACADEQANSPASDESNLNEPSSKEYELFPLPIGSDGGPLRSASPELDQRSFALQSVEGDPTLTGVIVTLSFARDELRFHGACNGSNAKYGLEAGQLRLGRVGTTLKGCASELQAKDAWLHDFMTSAPSMQVIDHTLTLRNEDATLVFVEGATAQADAGR